MTDSLYRLVYISRNQIDGGETEVRREIEQILQTSREKNQLSDLTGALMFNSDLFAQVLEGPHDDIQDTFERIQCDPRHSTVSLLEFKPVPERWFSNWSMAYQGGNTIASSKFSDIMQRSGFDVSKLEGEQVIQLLKQHLYET